MPAMLTKEDTDRCIAPLQALADREYRRGLEAGLAVALDACLWLHMTKGNKPAFTHDKVADMIEGRIQQLAQKEGLG